jgi:hypothetical protein
LESIKQAILESAPFKRLSEEELQHIQLQRRRRDRQISVDIVPGLREFLLIEKEFGGAHRGNLPLL